MSDFEMRSKTAQAWLDPAELAGPNWQFRNRSNQVAGLFLGYRDGRAIGSLDDRPVLTVAAARSGKGASLIVPNLLLYDGSVLAIDVGGELARITAGARRKKGQKVIVLDPFGVSGLAKGRFNPLDELDMNDPNVNDEAALLAGALVIRHEPDPHWTNLAGELVKALILVTLTLPLQERHLISVWHLLNASHPMVVAVARRAECGPRAALIKMLTAYQSEFGRSIVNVGRIFAAMPEREVAAVVSTAMSQLAFLDSPRMASAMQTSDVRLSDLKMDGATLYLCLPAERMVTHARWLRLIVDQAILAFGRSKTTSDIPALFVLDDFASLGKMQAVEMIGGRLADAGIRPWYLVDDLTQLKRVYGHGWESIVGQAGVMTVWSVFDNTTLDYVSHKLGRTADCSEEKVDPTAGRALVAPQELAQMLDRGKRAMLVMAAGQAPVIVQRAVYHEDQAFAGLFDA